MPHPAHPELGFESVEDLDPSTVDRSIVGPHIYTDGSKTEGKVGAALTEWRDEMEPGTPRSGSNPSARDSKSSLQMLTAPKPTTSGPCSAKTSGISRKAGSAPILVRAHAGTTGNERADELARNAALKKKTAADYDRYPLSYAKKVIRAASLDEWQQRYTEGGTGEITALLPEWKGRIVPRDSRSRPDSANPNGTRRIAQYPNRFKLKDSPYCACAPDKVQDVLHVLEECPIFGRERRDRGGHRRRSRRHGFPASLTTKQIENILNFASGSREGAIK
ncbi:hypothetical protein EVAR_66467_1 [Eumeta japonica]|uniref:RNase H type-1 domain-containing protein n=1 Tax=Eumeta variegata TaxID=151549 RepID=A0A4C1SFT7_EUMVA|nr:hypothetical protein EVAR_66467_1 [Eumeta japonica]